MASVTTKPRSIIYLYIYLFDHSFIPLHKGGWGEDKGGHARLKYRMYILVELAILTFICLCPLDQSNFSASFHCTSIFDG